MQELHEILSAMVAQKDKVATAASCCSTWRTASSRAVSQEFACKLDEVAILLLSTTAGTCASSRRRSFADLGTIPVTKRDSIAVNVLARKAGEVINNVPMVKHVSFFESIKLRDKPSPIQKMITMPIVVRGQPIGVAQISRKGETAREAGARLHRGRPAARAGDLRRRRALPGRGPAADY